MNEEYRLGKTAIRSMALHLRMLRLLGPLSLHCLETLLERGLVRHYRRGATIPVNDNGRRHHLLVLEGSITVERGPMDNTPDGSTGENALTATEAIYDYVPLLVAPDQPLQVTAITDSRCLLLNADLAERMLWVAEAWDDPVECRKIA